MNPELKNIHEHMIGLGLGALAHANWHANYAATSNPYWHELSVLQAAHAAEILIKARIAQEHPLLIFDQLPRSTQAGTELLGMKDLIERGRTVQYTDLPERLWAATGIRLKNLERFADFGRLRNTVQHFAVPSNRNCSRETLNFIYEVIDPFVNDCWGLYAIDENEDVEPYTYLVAGLIGRGILFLVSPRAARYTHFGAVHWPKDNDGYRVEMERRFAAARLLEEE
jgi:hypothetical protein